MTKPWVRPALIVLLIAAIVLLAAAADSAKTLFNKGKEAEARDHYEQAYDFYKQAFDLKPTDLAYQPENGAVRTLPGTPNRWA